MSLAGIPESVLENIPAGTPPAGVVSNFINPPSRSLDLIVLNTIFLTLMWTVVLMRLYAKARILHNMGWDDYTCVIAALASTAHSAVQLNCLKLGFGRHIWDIRVVTLLSASNVRQLSATSLVYPVVIYFVKLTILLLYLRIFGVYRSIRLACYFGIVFFTLFYIAYFGVQAGFLINCITEASLETSLCRNVYPLTIFQSAFNVASDIFVFAVPIPRILKLHVTRRQKIGLLVIFLAGLVACGVSIARLVVTAKTLNRADKFWYGALSGSLTLVEMNLAIIAACMSTLPGFLTRAKAYGSSIYKTLRSRIHTPSSSGTNNNSRQVGQETGSNTAGVAMAPASRKTLENANYIQLEDGAKNAASVGGLSSVETLPFWGEP